MTSFARRNPEEDHLLTPENSAFLLIDYQPVQVNSINSTDRHQLIQQIVTITKMTQRFNVPIILSTVNVATGRNQDTIAPLKAVLADQVSYDRTSINAWEDQDSNQAVKATGRKKLIIAGLWTEACVTFPTLDALKEGYEVYPVVDVIGGTSVAAHETALRRMEQADAQLTSLAQVACEWQRDWAHTDTVKGFTESLFDAGVFLKM